VDLAPAYRTVSGGEGSDALRADLESGRVDAVTFASASAVRGYVEAVGASLATRAPAITIGPVTSDAARAAGLVVAAESRQASVASLVEAVVTELAMERSIRPSARPPST
jgi:uroporphyrinogen III methyltransferase / synthase